MIRVRVAEEDSRTLEALRLIAKLMAQAKIRLDEAGELSVHGDGGPR
jgi:hypothetical protein